MKWTYEQLGYLGKWHTIETDEPPIVVNGRLKLAEGQGPRVRNVSSVGGDHTPPSDNA
jgi:hypothetical protein